MVIKTYHQVNLVCSQRQATNNLSSPDRSECDAAPVSLHLYVLGPGCQPQKLNPACQCSSVATMVESYPARRHPKH